ncbi:MAG: nucleotidyltransferase domain-containing protein [Verrucomicrobiae bacterium]|nr:nucleotidyltransferase domain-containing protein [Verrucomicrobiae bacterium]
MNLHLACEPIEGIDGENLRRMHDVLSSYLDIRRVWIFGSLARGRKSDWRSDLDLAVEGLPVNLHARFWSELDQAVSMPVDVIRWETASALLREEITKWGKLLYET